ncbi:MAG: zinc-binding dehydrogenase [Planctomycetota bacterium]|jgi:threonine dehydrogenase-like Zn-dependent dehydrogenase|nr:zinc-binding dehydrogenase [Planctomycetota bacterium]
MNQRIVIPEPGKVVIEDAPMPEPRENEALVKVLYGGICGSDLGTYRGTFAYVAYPRIPGHELAVEVAEAPENELGIAKGLLATLNPYFNCGKCRPCRLGRPNCCVDNQTLGAQRDGGFVKFFAIPLDRLYPSRGLGVGETALVEPFCISYHGVKRAGLRPGEKVLVIGAGTIGVLAMLAARHFGAEAYVTDVAPGKLAHAEKLGAAGTFVNSSRRALGEWTERVTSGEGFAATIEAVGLPSTFVDAVDAAASAGRVVVIGVSKQNAPDFNFTAIQKKELAIFGSRNALRRDFSEVVDLMLASGFSAEKLVSAVYDFADASAAFRDFSEKAGEMLKVLIRFS